MESRISTDKLASSIAAVVAASKKKPRKFVETVQLLIVLKKWDPRKDGRFYGTVKVLYAPRPKFRACILGDQQHCDEAKDLDLPFMNKNQIEEISKSSTRLNKLVKTYDAFLASPSLFNKLPGPFRRVLYVARKEPTLLTHDESMGAKVEELKSTVSFRMRRVACLCVTVGNVGMPREEMLENVFTVVDYLLPLVKGAWHNIRSLSVKSSMGPPQRLYG
ncbi:hypothetical protein HPB48_013479 [Haemaphysalis longicornis]|uniref:Large ribosomal subunit protein uL1 n=1 Tax=Haemaphysalis longicornis TaxID=44386 RepID=A0A9J6GSG9_HAELO|nr:hypothetical protein HPB48_013479 [Haemaphysalis longicornis]